MRNILCFLVVYLVFMNAGLAQQEVNLYSDYSESEIRRFLTENNFTIVRFTTGIPDSLEGAVLFTSFIAIGQEPRSYSSKETVFFRDAGINLEGDLQGLSSSKVLYTVYGYRDGNIPVILFLGSASWIYELSYSNVNRSELEYFRIYLPSLLNNTLKELCWFLANDLKLIIRKPEIEFVKIYSGEFNMGASKKEKKRYTMPYSMFGDREQHLEKVGSFEISKYEITFDQYDMFCKATGKALPADKGFGRGNRPVIFVSYFDAVDFADWMGCRLPTETEWEYACRAGTTTYYYTGECICCDQANVSRSYDDECCTGKYCTKSQTMPVGSYDPNPWGLHDMHGNVSEWTSSWFDDYITHHPLENGSKTVKGGSYRTGNTESSSAARFGILIRDDERNYVPTSYEYIGFRVVRDLK
jgi:formylglycine-generating enzyme required for sulfatase activity